MTIYIVFVSQREKKGKYAEVEIYRKSLPDFYTPLGGSAQRDLATHYSEAKAVAEHIEMEYKEKVFGELKSET